MRWLCWALSRGPVWGIAAFHDTTSVTAGPLESGRHTGGWEPQQGEELSAEEQVRRASLEEAGQRALSSRPEGFSLERIDFPAVDETLSLTDLCMVRAITGFHGGGGTHRLKPNFELAASGIDRRRSCPA